MKPEIVKRKIKQKQTKILTLRLTPEEISYLNNLKEDLEFETVRELILFSLEVVGKLREWEKQGQKFYIGREENELRQLIIEFSKQSI